MSPSIASERLVSHLPTWKKKIHCNHVVFARSTSGNRNNYPATITCTHGSITTSNTALQTDENNYQSTTISSLGPIPVVPKPMTDYYHIKVNDLYAALLKPSNIINKHYNTNKNQKQSNAI
jgi:hypothetical protein